MQGKSVSRSKVFPTCNSREGCSTLFTPWLFCLGTRSNGCPAFLSSASRSLGHISQDALLSHESQSRFTSVKLLIKALDAIVAAGSASLECSVLERSAGINIIQLCGLLALAAHTTKISTVWVQYPCLRGMKGVALSGALSFHTYKWSLPCS
jgi:hypothetical protein